MSENTAPAPAPKKRVESIDAFRGFTIFSMIFVIMVSGYKNLPLTFSHFGSAPVSTFKHATEDGDPAEWAFWQGTAPKEECTLYRPAKVVSVDGNSKYTVAVLNEKGTTLTTLTNVPIRHAKPLREGESVIARAVDPANTDATKWTPETCALSGGGNGCTFCDLVAPFFVFIVGVCIPLSRGKRGSAWWKHVGFRTLNLILAGVIYISLILKLSWWWGILQAIGVAYFMGAAAMFLPSWGRWLLVAAIAAFHSYMSTHFSWWLELGNKNLPFFTIADLRNFDFLTMTWIKPHGDFLRPLTIHCTPWASISYGLITIVGTLLGEAVSSREPKKIISQCLIVGIVCSVVGYLLHKYYLPMNKDYVSASYSIFTSGMGALFFLVFYLVIDIAGFKVWASPFKVFGANALLAYFMQPLVRIFFVALGLYTFFGNRGGWDGVLWGLIWTGCLWVATLICNKKNIYWKL